MSAAAVKAALGAIADPAYATGAARYFKTGPGQYGEGDVFIGVRVPQTRAVVKQFADLPSAEVELLLASDVHEHRLAGLLIMVRQFEVAGRRGDFPTQQRILSEYLRALDAGRINNWDLVDSSATVIVGGSILGRSPQLLFDLAERPELWHRRVAVLASFALCDAGEPSVTLALATHLLSDRRDLIQKAMGWSLRHLGKRVGPETLITFLETNAPLMGRTALSYATEHLDAPTRARLRAL